MKLQDKSFHKSWINNIQKREKDITKNFIFNKFILKIVFVALIILSILIVLRWWQKVPNKKILNLDEQQNFSQPDTLVKPTILFKNKNNSIVTVKAYEAKKDIKNSTIIILKKPEGHYTISNKKDIYFYAAKGILDNNKQILELMENVIIQTSKGTKLFTNKLIYNVENNILSSNDNITLNGTWGTLNGKELIYNIEDSTVVIKGRPQLSLYNKKGNIK